MGLTDPHLYVMVSDAPTFFFPNLAPTWEGSICHNVRKKRGKRTGETKVLGCSAGYKKAGNYQIYFLNDAKMVKKKTCGWLLTWGKELNF